MTAVMLSIRPEWCAKIASGSKTIEVRKTRPKIKAPFKCYIYQTLPKCGDRNERDGRVIGEFVCDKILDICVEMSNPDNLPAYPFPCTCLTDKEILEYLGNGKTGYGWHISELKIYDKPKELSEFFVWKKCDSCRKSGYESTACGYDENCKVPAMIDRAPQSWCYVEELESEQWLT